jgi:serine/threonine-protein kinase
MDNSARNKVALEPVKTPISTRSGTMPLPNQISDAPFQVGEEIAGRYVVERAIAEGGMGIVLAARHCDLDEVVAIKFLKPEFARNPDIIGRFAREAKACTRIKSEYVAKVLDVGVSPSRGPFIVMEYLEGQDLSEQLVISGRLPYERAVELLLQTCEALAQAHAHEIIHRDIKPENLFVIKGSADVPVVKVLDFGVSKAALAGSRIFGNEIDVSKTQTLMGTPLYMSPEQLRGQIDVDAKADVWAVGTVLYELLTGEPPFTGTTVPEVCASVLETTPKKISDRAPEVPFELEEVIAKCLEKTPGKRYSTIAELAIALQPFGPKRARMCVERAIAAAKSANQVPPSLTSPISLAPPSNGPNSAGPPSSSMRTPPPMSIQSTSPSVSPNATSPSFAPPPNKKKTALVGIAIGALVVIAGISFAARSLSSKDAKSDTPPPPTAAAVPAPTTPAATTAVAAALPDPTTVGTPSDKPNTTAAPNVITPKTTFGAPGGGGFGGFHAPGKPSAAATPSVARTASASAPPSTPATPSAPPAATPNAKQSAIDDRK